MFDIITFGSATKDTFLETKDIKTIQKKSFLTEEGICLSLGSKIDVKNIYFNSGGGGTNTANTFSRQGFKTAYCGFVGEDKEGQEILEELEKLKINTSFLEKTKLKKTNQSVVINIKDKDRTILVYRGASEIMSKKNINKLKSKWFYLAPLSGKLADMFEYIVDYAEKRNIKIAVNPGNSQLCFPKQKLWKILKKTDILILNQEEASMLTNIPFKKNKQIFESLVKSYNGITVMTKGPLGVDVSDGKDTYTAKPFNSKVVDRTGAGDSFASGFVSEYMISKDIEKSIQLGIANATACLKEWGAKQGLLKKGQKFRKVKVFKSRL